MNILFHTLYQPLSTKGGTEHITNKIAESLKKDFGYTCYSSYTNPLEEKGDCFENEFVLDLASPHLSEAIRNIINENHIERVIVQTAFEMIPFFRNAIRETENCKLVFVHHFSPGWECDVLHFGVLAEKFKDASGWHKLYEFARMLGYPVIKYRRDQYVKGLYRQAWAQANQIVLLSQRYVDGFMKIVQTQDKTKFAWIPNALTFDGFADENILKNKKKTVLMVSRLDERQKRIKLALKIWKRICNSPISEGWELKIVGDGDISNVDEYRAYAQNESVRNVTFFGRTVSKPYFEEASIFMMTSLSEGFPLTLNEAHQYGAVPLAFDTFVSLHDMIEDGYDGYIIQENDINNYVSRMHSLMKNNLERNKMARNGIESCKRYLPQNVIKSWDALLKH